LYRNYIVELNIIIILYFNKYIPVKILNDLWMLFKNHVNNGIVNYLSWYLYKYFFPVKYRKINLNVYVTKKSQNKFIVQQNTEVDRV